MSVGQCSGGDVSEGEGMWVGGWVGEDGKWSGRGDGFDWMWILFGRGGGFVLGTCDEGFG